MLRSVKFSLAFGIFSSFTFILEGFMSINPMISNPKINPAMSTNSLGMLAKIVGSVKYLSESGSFGSTGSASRFFGLTNLV